MSEGHARLGPSNHRWPHCPGSIREEAAYEDFSGDAAIDGTGSHLLLELCLQHGVRADTYDQQIIGLNHPDKLGGWLVGIDRCERVQMCLDYISLRVKELKAQFPYATVNVVAESQTNPGFTWEREDWWGTVDVTITVESLGITLFVEICDYKDGRIYVDCYDNSQLISYAWGRIDEVNRMHQKSITGVRMTIVQPKSNVPVRWQDTTVDHVFAEARKLAYAAAATDAPDAPLIPDGDGKGYCRWCKHAKNCAPLQEMKLRGIKVMTETSNKNSDSLFEVMQNAALNIETLSSDKLAEIADTEEATLAVFKRIRDEIERRIDLGDTVPGYAKQPGRGSNVWNAEPEVVEKRLKGLKLTKADMYPAKLISPSQFMSISNLTDAQKEKIKEDLITYTVGKPTLKKVARQEKPTVEMMFGNIALQTPDTVVQSQTVSFI